MEEQWKSIIGYEGWYEVSNLGRIKRVKKEDNTYEGRILIPKKKRYIDITLCKNGKAHTHRLHKFVAECFIGPRNGLQINHKDGNKHNNIVDNLEYVTAKENSQHARRMGLFKPFAKIKYSRIPIVFDMRKYGFSLKEIGQKFGVGKSCIWSILQGGRMDKTCR